MSGFFEVLNMDVGGVCTKVKYERSTRTYSFVIVVRKIKYKTEPMQSVGNKARRSNIRRLMTNLPCISVPTGFSFTLLKVLL